jgi:hypothetical protein
MKKFTFTFIIVSVLMVISTLTSCKKDNTIVIPPTKAELLTAQTWKLTGWAVDPALPFTTGGPAISNWYAQLNNCSKDDIFKFSASTYAFEEGASKCNANDPTVWESGSWSFNTSQTVLLMNKTSPKTSNYEYKLMELTATKLVLVLEIQGSNNVVYTSTQTFAPN